MRRLSASRRREKLVTANIYRILSDTSNEQRALRGTSSYHSHSFFSRCFFSTSRRVSFTLRIANLDHWPLFKTCAFRAKVPQLRDSQTRRPLRFTKMAQGQPLEPDSLLYKFAQ